ncbi:uncharacterized protein LOC110604875 [Manihot esculenta]|uniref:Uncharacterized protein n=1 Tax=Manihot esculenta TaxID=3983 RepID=A0A2C9U4T1_MANES|nr:uncharacterized protein LOC110604875 [Manihot esculenta]OAY24722.1 hypothetical protein MANES_17G038600v8 [Manihot esculenta]
MGNCCRRGSSSAVWAGDDWGSVGQELKRARNHNTIIERQRLLGEEMGAREVTVKITKRELEALMERVEMQGLSMEQVLVKLINSGDNFEILEFEDHQHHHHHRSWKPALQSIPEVN